MMRKEQALNEGWQLHTAGQPDWQPARVPGTVYTTLYENGRIPDPYWRDNAEQLLPLMEQDYEYRLAFDLPAGYETAPRLLLRFEGVDTLGEITLNGRLLGRTDNMHRTWEFEITGCARPRGNQLLVKLASPLRYIRDAFAQSPVRGAEDAMDGFVHLRKAHCMFGWDWGAHLPDAGLFRPVVLVAADARRLGDVMVRQHHKEHRVELELAVRDAQGDRPEYRACLYSPEGECLYSGENCDTIPVPAPGSGGPTAWGNSRCTGCGWNCWTAAARWMSGKSASACAPSR